jgi:hypothetical protein
MSHSLLILQPADLSMSDKSASYMVALCVDLQVSEVEGVAESASDQRFAVVVHVLSDYAFKKYLQHCSQSDLMLLRGMLLRVRGAGAGADRALLLLLLMVAVPLLLLLVF